MADLLAKDGLTSKEFLQINIQHLKTQSYHLRFNNDINIEHNIRKTIKRITNFQYFERHLAYQNLHKVKLHSQQYHRLEIFPTMVQI